MPADDPLRATVKGLTLLASLVAYGALAIYILSETWNAKSGKPPDIPGVQAAALGGLAVALGAGYAAVLGVPVNTTLLNEIQQLSGWWPKLRKWIASALFERTMLGAGVLLYLVVGAAMCVTYALYEGETPEVVKTISIGFAGYVIAYIGAAYQKFGAA